MPPRSHYRNLSIYNRLVNNADDCVLFCAAMSGALILYESFIHPLTILSGLPSAALGALLALRVVGFDLSMIALIGLLMLIGIVKKNAIMMIDVALHNLRSPGMTPSEAIHEACVRRFRPIMMTTFCALLGALPIS